MLTTCYIKWSTKGTWGILASFLITYGATSQFFKLLSTVCCMLYAFILHCICQYPLYVVGRFSSPPQILHLMMQAPAKQQQERLISGLRPVDILFPRSDRSLEKEAKVRFLNSESSSFSCYSLICLFHQIKDCVEMKYEIFDLSVRNWLRYSNCDVVLS